MFSLEYVGSSYDYVNDEKRDSYVIYKNDELIYIETEKEVWMYLMLEIDEEKHEVVFVKRPTFFDDDKVVKTRAYYDNQLYFKVKDYDSLYNYLKEIVPLLFGFELKNL